MKEKLRKLAVIVISVLVVAGLGFMGWKYYQAQKQLELLQNPNKANQAEVNKLVSEVSLIMQLPEGESPTVATVSDKEKLQDKPFFAKAENDDKVLLYTQAKKAILYRPSTKKIIEVAPLNIDDTATSDNNQATPEATTEPITVALYNGTATAGLTNGYEPKIQATGLTTTISTRQNAAKQDYTESMVVDVSGTKTATVQALAQRLSLQIRSLPEGERKPTTDVLIILGSDAQ